MELGRATGWSLAIIAFVSVATASALVTWKLIGMATDQAATLLRRWYYGVATYHPMQAYLARARRDSRLEAAFTQWYLRIERSIRRAGLPPSLPLAFGLVALTGMVAATAAIWAAAYFHDPWITALAPVVILMIPPGILELMAGTRRWRVEGQVAAAAYGIASDLLRGHNPLQAIERTAPKLPDPMRGILVKVSGQIRAGGYHRDAELQRQVSEILVEELTSRRGHLFGRVLARAWDQPELAARMLLSFSAGVSQAARIRRQGQAKVAGHRFWGWSILFGSLAAHFLIPWLIPETATYLKSPQGLSGVRWWLGSAIVSLGAARLAGRLPGG